MVGRIAASSLAFVLFAHASIARAAVVPVSDAATLETAVNNAQPGDEIVLAAGTYTIDHNILCDSPGTPSAPIVVRAEALGDAMIRFDATEGFHVTAPHWTFENLDIEGICASHDACEHAFHITGAADDTTVRGCRLREYNAMIKGNGTDTGAGYEWPDDVLIENNELFNSTARNTANPVTPLDIVGGRRWVVRANFIHDHAKGGGDNVSYAAFLKGNSRDGLFERNLVVCELLHTGQVRLGLSFGGGGTSPDSICEDGSCSPEHQNGVMRNNIIANCPADVGIYLNEAANVRIYNNTLFATSGIDVRFAASVADIRNNLLTGSLRERDGGSYTGAANVVGASEADFRSWFTDPDAVDFGLVDGATFVDQGESLGDVTDDFCTNLRDDGATDIGAVEFDGDGPCDTTRPHRPSGQGGEPDAGPGMGPDAGSAGGDGDAGTGPDEDLGGGCGCEHVGARPGTGAGAAALLMLMVVGLRRGRARTGRAHGAVTSADPDGR